MRRAGLLLICFFALSGSASAFEKIAAAGPRPVVSDGERYVAWTLRGRLRVHDAKTGRTRDQRMPPGCDRIKGAAAGTVLLGCADGPARIWTEGRIRPVPGAHAEDHFEWIGRHWAIGFAGEESAPKAPAVPVAVNLQGGERIEEANGFGSGCIDPDRSSPTYAMCDELGTVTTSGAWRLQRDCCMPDRVSLFRRGRLERHLARGCEVYACSSQMSAGWVTWADQEAARRATVGAFDLATRKLTRWRLRARAVSVAHTRDALFIRANGAILRAPRPGRTTAPVCGPSSARTVAETGRLRIYADRSREVVCAPGSDRRWSLTEPYDDTECGSQGCWGRDRLRVAGPWVLEAIQWITQDTFVNLAVRGAGARRETAIARVDFLHGVVLGPSGGAAVIATNFSGPDRKRTVVVQRFGACGHAVLDEGDGVRPDSLRIAGNRATWVRDGALRSADLCPRRKTAQGFRNPHVS